MTANPIDFCVHLAKAIHQKQKTTTRKPLSAYESDKHNGGKLVPSPYGMAGDTLWVREPWGTSNNALVYQADYMLGDGWKTRMKLPDDFAVGGDMVQGQSRSSLLVASVDIVSLQTLDEAGAKLAGTIPTGGRTTYLDEFKAQWDATYTQQQWASNPLCWLVVFTLQ